MKLVLMSAYNTDAITKKIVELTGKPASKISAAILNECSQIEDWDVRWLLNSLSKVAETFGGGMYLCDLRNESLAENEKRIAKADVIWCMGGHVDYLQSVFNKSGFTKTLPKLLKTKVWVGSSAGSCVTGVRPPNEFRLDTGKSISCDVDRYLELVNLSIRPHVGADSEHGEGLEASIGESKINGGVPVYALSDDSAVIVDGGKIYMVGHGAKKFINGEFVEGV
ncbi:MAG: Type 1 glutamine amidotransferase-like domain-containing protein [Firmicutes bacterium]|nr:Type 1 glutamine amidotransferase-like domain-containing protein [Bacillota bacterium]